MAILPVQYSIMVIEIDDFSSRAPSTRTLLLRQMRDVVRPAISIAGYLWESLQGKVDMGDGALMLPIPGAAPARIAGPVITAIDGGLAAQAREAGMAPPIQFRVALHAGPEDSDPSGPSADAVRLACMLARAQPLRDALRAAARAHMAVIASAEAYTSSIRHDYRAVDPAAYLPVRVACGHHEHVTAWITVPGYPAPPGIHTSAGLRDAANARAAPGTSENAPGPALPAVSQQASVVMGDLVAYKNVHNYGGGSQ